MDPAKRVIIETLPENIRALIPLAEYSELIGDDHRAKAYRKVIFKDAKPGQRIQTKLNEFAETGRIKEAEEAKRLIAILKNFMRIEGVGVVKAKKWLDAGYKTIKDIPQSELISQTSSHPSPALLSIKYIDDLSQKIPRHEVFLIAASIRYYCPSDPIRYDIAGSYRRGANECNDVDILICVNDTSGYMKQLSNNIRSSPGYIGDLAQGEHKYSFLYRICDAISANNTLSDLSDGEKRNPSTNKRDPSANKKESSASKHKVRRCDIILTIPSEYIAALCYFTGSKWHNERLRGIAKSKGMRLNQTGLYNSDKQKIELKSEEDVYKELGLQYVHPEQRND